LISGSIVCLSLTPALQRRSRVDFFSEAHFLSNLGELLHEPLHAAQLVKKAEDKLRYPRFLGLHIDKDERDLARE
jgi:hypothetical protein